MAKLYIVNGRIFYEDSDALSLVNGAILNSETTGGSITGSGTPQAETATATGSGQRVITNGKEINTDPNFRSAGSWTLANCTISSGKLIIPGDGIGAQTARYPGLLSIVADQYYYTMRHIQERVDGSSGLRTGDTAGGFKATNGEHPEIVKAAANGSSSNTFHSTPTSSDTLNLVALVVREASNPQAATATATGAGAVVKTGSGSPQAATATATGAGTVGTLITGTGAPQAATATATGTGERIIPGSGTPQAATATASSGVGEIIKTGSGTPQAETATSVGAGTVGNVVQGSGTPQAETATSVGTGERVITGSGTPQATTATSTGAATRIIFIGRQVHGDPNIRNGAAWTFQNCTSDDGDGTLIFPGDGVDVQRADWPQQNGGVVSGDYHVTEFKIVAYVDGNAAGFTGGVFGPFGATDGVFRTSNISKASNTTGYVVTGTNTATLKLSHYRVWRSGQPQAETATVVGEGVVTTIITGSGTPQAETATSVGAGTVGGFHTGSGTPQAETATATNGVAERVIVAGEIITTDPYMEDTPSWIITNGSIVDDILVFPGDGVGAQRANFPGEASVVSGEYYFVTYEIINWVDGAPFVTIGGAQQFGGTGNGVRTYTLKANISGGTATEIGTALDTNTLDWEWLKVYKAPSPQAETATATGAGTVSGAVSGTGTPQAETATATGAGVIVKTGSGTPQAETATATGAGTVTEDVYTGTGTPQAETATATGAGLILGDIIGSGAAQAETATASGLAIVVGPDAAVCPHTPPSTLEQCHPYNYRLYKHRATLLQDANLIMGERSNIIPDPFFDGTFNTSAAPGVDWVVTQTANQVDGKLVVTAGAAGLIVALPYPFVIPTAGTRYIMRVNCTAYNGEGSFIINGVDAAPWTDADCPGVFEEEVILNGGVVYMSLGSNALTEAVFEEFSLFEIRR